MLRIREIIKKISYVEQSLNYYEAKGNKMNENN